MVLKCSFTFWIYKSRIDKDGSSPVYMRIYVNEEKLEIRTGVRVSQMLWDSNSQKVKTKHPDSQLLNQMLENYREDFNEVYRDLLQSKIEFTAEMFKKRMLKEEDSIVRTIMEAITAHNKHMKELEGKDYAPATITRYNTLRNLLELFLFERYNRKDFLLGELSIKFLQDFEHWMKVDRNNSHNTAAKYLKNFKKVINTAIINEWMVKNPFLGYKIKIKPIMKDYLSEEELTLIEMKSFEIERLELVRKVFLFQCYTGLAYIDVKGLTPLNIVTQKGAKWLVLRREKTDSFIRILLLRKAQEILNQNRNSKSGLIFKMFSNQKMNAYLKEIADLCGINKQVSSHTARRTFATLALTKGVSIEAVSKALGHANIQTTQIYAKVTTDKLLNDFSRME